MHTTTSCWVADRKFESRKQETQAAAMVYSIWITHLVSRGWVMVVGNNTKTFTPQIMIMTVKEQEVDGSYLATPAARLPSSCRTSARQPDRCQSMRRNPSTAVCSSSSH
eukprot:GHVU01061062.1.p1 GENE.GHVU01061062.1~~GHVU01061062.1.p1  ORF type:complete len:109 (+),score=9.22 GHVU01061062.1:207-533(+)